MKENVDEKLANFLGQIMKVRLRPIKILTYFTVNLKDEIHGDNIKWKTELIGFILIKLWKVNK